MRPVIFSGTTEGRELSEFLHSKKIPATVCVATEYGKTVMGELTEDDVIKIHVGRLDYEGMLGFIKDYDICIDATHPYATDVTDNIKKACNSLGIKYLRLLRNKDERENETENTGIHVRSVREAAVFLSKNAKQHDVIFVSTGSKEMEEYTVLPDYENRVILRVLPVKEAYGKCEKYHFKNVIYEKGPFGFEQNLRHFEAYKADWLVTKAAGKAGGFLDKINAAKSLGIKILIVDRPVEEEGYSIEEIKRFILEMCDADNPCRQQGEQTGSFAD